MNEETKFFICKHCGNIVQMVKDSGAPLVCCGDPMDELKANTTDASQEKHVPVIEVDGSKVTVTVGSVAHPMTDEHHIVWAHLQTNSGCQRKRFKIGAEPKLCFTLCKDDTPVAVYAYCNLHGLWKADIK